MSGLRDELDEVPGEDLAERAREEVDKLRSVQLYAELRAYQQTVNALRETVENVKTLATKLSKEYLQAYSIGLKAPRQWRMSKYAWYAVIAAVVVVGVIILARMFLG